MQTSWADLATNSAPEIAGASNTTAPSRPVYVPPHLRNRGASASTESSSAPPPPNVSTDNNAGSRWGAPRNGWGNRSGGWDRREVNPFEDQENAAEEGGAAFGEEQGNTGINFDAYEDIPVETSGENVPPPVNTFAEIDLGEALNQNIRRCKYVKPTPVQRYGIPISLGGRDLMACAQTGSGKTAAFCFPIISGIMRGQGQPLQRPPRGVRTVYPLALVLSPTRELSMQVSTFLLHTLFISDASSLFNSLHCLCTSVCNILTVRSFQIHEEARKFSYQTGVRVVVAYGGAPINQQVLNPCSFSILTLIC